MNPLVETPEPEAQDPKKEATTAGNYFVSNYPPFSFWKPDFVPDFIAALDRPPHATTPLGLYVHIPFCRRRCHFCYFKVYTDKNAAAIQGYIDAAIHEFQLYRSRPFAGDRPLNFVYFGGGTPSYLSVRQLVQLTNGLKKILPWTRVEEVAFECEPGTLNADKLKAIQDCGVTRLSLGIENFDDRVLEINGRAHRSKEIYRAYENAAGLGFPQINIDLIAGMVEETEANWRQCVKRAINLSPDSITVYQMEVPYNTTIYKEMRANGKLVAPVAGWSTKRRWVAEAFAAFEKAGYTIGSAYTAVKDTKKTRFVYRDQLWAGADLVSLGVASFGHIGGTHYQNEHRFEPYMEALAAGRFPVCRAMTPDDDERLIREFVLQLKLGRVSSSYFEIKFGVNLKQRFRDPLERIRREGYLTVEGDCIRLNREGLLRIDRLLHEFFLPRHQNVRYS